MTRHAGCGSAKPASACGPRSSRSNSPPICRRVASAMTSVSGRGQRLQPGGKVRRLADDPALLCGTLADQIADHDEPAGDAEPHVQRLRRREPADRVDDGEPGAHRPLGVVLMRLADSRNRSAPRRPYTWRQTRRSGRPCRRRSGDRRRRSRADPRDRSASTAASSRPDRRT